MTLLSVEQARARILSHIQPITTEKTPLVDCINRILAVNIIAADALPPFDNSAMDGFALRAADTSNAAPASPLTLRVVADIPAGTTPTTPLSPGEAARIMTGAQMPEGADAVIPVEDTDFHDRSAGTPPPENVTIARFVETHENVRRRGTDALAGDTILKAGVRLNAQSVGILAMLGFMDVEVFRKPRVGLLSSGNELLKIGAALVPGKIRDSNSSMLAALIQNAHAEVIHLGIAKDTRESVENLLEKAAAQGVDVILSSAGVSVGAFDYVKEVVEANGSLNFWQVNMRPGKPLAFGKYRNIPFIGLPGNPVSAFIGFEVFVRSTLERLGGLLDVDRSKIRVRCEEEILSDGRESYLRAIVHEKNGQYSARLTGHQGSGNLLSLVQADALLIIPAGVKCVPAGQEVNAWLL
jgi:molybdopterin molybdotransferase